MAKKKMTQKKMTRKETTRKKATPKKAAPKKAATKVKAAKTRRSPPVKVRPAKKSTPRAKPSKLTTGVPDYGPTFFLTANNDTAQAYEIDGTPHSKTVKHYRLEHADIREFEEQDGKILYKVKPLRSPAG